ncbi:hypothetical protein SAMN05660226_00333 [Parapedobacter luteus]|uniref:Uncharacterized protein n=1 Tax=Parapedobacter luteus TaxID=623280 RepID=A0A1T4ZZZ0_9SPHI|nr:hypothetical protein [Parapedobacter luteus]SKB28069.1 hypothetical protein SAMN05660226_00333 [Parapedobacter luteus]
MDWVRLVIILSTRTDHCHDGLRHSTFYPVRAEPLQNHGMDSVITTAT